MSGAETGRDTQAIRLPLVEIFETVEGEGTQAGYPTVFVRLFGCPLRCTWCDTPYSYAPAKAEFTMSIDEIVLRVASYKSARVCLTGGEPLMYRDHSATLLQALAELPRLVDVHVETSGAIDITPFLQDVKSSKVRYIVDYKLKESGETANMVEANFTALRPQDELKFVIASDDDFDEAMAVLDRFHPLCTVLVSPVFGAMEPDHLVDRLLKEGRPHVKLNLQIHKVIWDPNRRGV
ncbi:7-carboxy-7-deazaguanine synthase QueE [Ferroacidibacillus organovorans]|uniref:7-carboxy-7-deazaguanine synthase n=1 Tax=Ferroacidibacillus organovorans TaxID=1765683 RepID=A0A124IW13_9BACL|nr:radical SAM protein [Ferroacidibacillus organovorans]KUO95975.1 radical SAM protein [Ferroacidibacillus organovorans]